MVTTFFLNGGNSALNTTENIAFRKSIIAEISDNKNVLFCYFGKDQTEWGNLFTRDSENLKSVCKDLIFNLSLEEGFENQCLEADLIIFGGGDSFMLIDKLKQFTNLNDILKGKILVGSSAGACALSKYFYSNDRDILGDGLGLLNLKVHCHYEPNKLSNIHKLHSYKENIEIIALAEQQFVRIYY